MILRELARRIGAGTVVEAGRLDTEIGRVWAGDHISHLLAESTADTLIVSRLAATSLVRSAALVDAPAVCLADGNAPGADVARLAEALRVAVLVSPHSLDMTRARAREQLGLLPGATA